MRRRVEVEWKPLIPRAPKSVVASPITGKGPTEPKLPFLEEYEPLLKRVYYSTKGFVSAKKLQDTITRDYNVKLPLSFIRQWLSEQGIEQITKPVKRRTTLSYNVTTPHELHEADIMYLDKTKAGFKYVLGVIDVGSRYLVMIPLKTRDTPTVMKAFKEVYKIIPHPKTLQTDPGSEFISNAVAAYVKDHDVIHRVLSPHRHAAIIERVFLTIQRPLYKMRDSMLDQDWVKILPGIVISYNNRTHRTIGVSPSEALMGEPVASPIKKLKPSDIKPPAFKLGEKVRIRIPSKRAVDFTYSDDTYMITRIIPFNEATGRPTVYHLEDDNSVAFTEGELLSAKVVKKAVNPKRWRETFK